jgi:hypothetical protein
MSNNKTVLVDLDGTIAINKHRKYLIDPDKSNPPNWDAFYLACKDDSPNTPVIEIIKALNATGHEIHIISGRGKIAEKSTLKWLESFKVPFSKLTMREIGDFTDDAELKKEWLLKYYPEYKTQILCVIDDRKKVVDMWRSMDLTCLQVANGNF